MSRKHESARQGAPDNQLSRLPEITTGAGRLTPLQEALVATYNVVEAARSELDPQAWRAFVWIVCDHVGAEAARLVVAEALEATEEAA